MESVLITKDNFRVILGEFGISIEEQVQCLLDEDKIIVLQTDEQGNRQLRAISKEEAQRRLIERQKAEEEEENAMYIALGVIFVVVAFPFFLMWLFVV